MNHDLHEQLDQLKVRLNWLAFCVAMLAILVVSQIVRGHDAQLAEADRLQFPPATWHNFYYVSTAAVAPEDRDELTIALKLVVPSTSRQVILERCLPVQVGDTLYRLNLADLEWDYNAWRKIVAAHPYTYGGNPLVMRADWLLLQLADAHESTAPYALLYGNAQTRDEVFGLFGVNNDPAHRFGLIEGKSGVNVAGTRWVENRPVDRGYLWYTRDSIELTGEHDMLEQPDGNFKHDGEEIIIGLPKLHLASGTRGVLQAYFLANGEGKLVGRAPVDLVVDHTNFRNLSEIRSPGSCIQCHESGLNPFKKNELRSYIESGVEAYAEYNGQLSLEAFHFSNLANELDRNSEDFRAMVLLATGEPSPKAAVAFRVAVNRYIKSLTLDRAAAELDTTAQEFRSALSWASAQGTRLTARLSGLAHGQTINREAWEEQYLNCKAILANWSKR